VIHRKDPNSHDLVLTASAELNTLVVSPKCQRMGIGTKLLEEGLREVDEAGLQAVLGASPDGEGLYKKFGFKEFEIMDIKLWEYEGGEECGIARHVVMHRPAKKRS
jgi:ribosomal protein S18 acetylase RimI-like enzyme